MTQANQELKFEIYEYLQRQESPVTISHIQANLSGGHTNQKISALCRQLLVEGAISRQDKNGFVFYSANDNGTIKVETKAPSQLDIALAKINQLEQRIAELEQEGKQNNNDNYYSSYNNDSGLFVGFDMYGKPTMGWKI